MLNNGKVFDTEVIKASQVVTIYLMGDDPVTTDRRFMKVGDLGVEVKVKDGSDFYPWFSVTRIKTRTVIG